MKDLFPGNDNLRDHCKVEFPFITDIMGKHVFGDEVEDWKLVPRWSQILLDSQGFKTRLFQPDFTSSIIGIIGRDRSCTNFLVININGGAGRITSYGEPAMDTTTGKDDDSAEAERHHDQKRPIQST